MERTVIMVWRKRIERQAAARRSPGRIFAWAGIALLGLLPAGGARGAGGRVQVISTRFRSGDVVVAVRRLSPVSGERDAAPRIQRAIESTAGEGGGVVFLDAGRYPLRRPLVIREGVTVRGDWAPPGIRNWEQGTVLAVYAGKGKPAGPAAVTLERGSGVRGLVFWYPEQDAEALVPYPWCLRSSQAKAGDNVTVLDVTLVNPYQGIRIGPEWNELHVIRNVYGTPLHRGLWLDTTTDIGRITDVDFRPDYWEASGFPGAPHSGSARAALRRALLAGAEACDIGRSDWEYFYRFQAQGYGIGIRFHRGQKGDSNAVMFGCAFRGCGVALQLDRVNAVGLAASGCVFAGIEHGLYAAPTFIKTAQFNGCEFRASKGAAVFEGGEGLLSFQNCRFRDWAGPALDIRGGSLTLLGCEFRKPGRALRLGKAVERARIIGNRFPGGAGIENLAVRADYAFSSIPRRFARPDLSPAVPAPAVRPRGDRLFSVRAFGADPAAADNTGAFSKALKAAGAAGGGTVYVPPGYYRFRGHLTVPSGVELRGCFDVPHHTISGGSVLLPEEGRGEARGTPFLQLEAGAGLRGFTVWYPEQDLLHIRAYPWTVRALGPRCWVKDVTLGNAYQGVDFGSFPSTGHVISYLAGAVLRRGLWVSKCDGDGWVEDVQFNPHYSVRIPGDIPHPGYGRRDVGGAVIDYQRHHLEGLVFGRCRNEHIRGTFLYAAWDGIAFRDDHGGTHARVIEHGTDTGSRSLYLEATDPRGVDFIDAQLVALGRYVRGAIVSAPDFHGRVRLFNSQVWAGPCTGRIGGHGEILIQQMGTRSGPILVEGGRFRILNTHFSERIPFQIEVGRGCESAWVLANLASRATFRLRNAAGPRCWARANSADRPPPEGVCEFRTGWEPGEPQGRFWQAAERGGGIRAVAQAVCRPERSSRAHSGKYALHIAGEAKAAYAFAYFRVFDGPFSVRPDTVLAYWIRPDNELGRSVGIDLVDSTGRPLRDSGMRDSRGRPVHPSVPRGVVGRWRRIRIPLGRKLEGRKIMEILFAFDSRRGPGRFSAWIDDLRIETPSAGRAWRIVFRPAPGRVARGTAVRLETPNPEGVKSVRYTVDGLTPDARSPRVSGPIRLEQPGLQEIRAVIEGRDGKLSGTVLSGVYEVSE